MRKQKTLQGETFNMKGYEIFSDSSCDMSQEQVEKYKVNIIPFYVTLNQEDYRKENEEISKDEFYHTLIEKKIVPKTSLPSVEDYMRAFQQAIEQGKDILCICLTHSFSGSYQSAMNAKMILKEKYENTKIIIIDSIQATGGQGLLVIQAAKMKEEGYSLEDNADKLEEIKYTARIMFTLDTLEYLQKGGRIGKAKVLAGTMLNLKPLIQMKDTELIPFSNVRGRKKALDKIVTMLEEYFQETGEDYSDYEFGTIHAMAEEEAVKVQSNVENIIGKPIEYPLFQIGVTIGTYTGTRVVGVCFIRKYSAKDIAI